MLNVEAMEIWIVAPKGFRPSSWVDMLCDIDEAFDLDPHLVDPCYEIIDGRKCKVLVMMSTVLNDTTHEKTAREELFKEVMCRAAALGLNVSVPEDFAGVYPTWWVWLQEYCDKAKLTLSTR